MKFVRVLAIFSACVCLSGSLYGGGPGGFWGGVGSDAARLKFPVRIPAHSYRVFGAVRKQAAPPQ